jgi:hypothetical protein
MIKWGYNLYECRINMILIYNFLLIKSCIIYQLDIHNRMTDTLKNKATKVS